MCGHIGSCLSSVGPLLPFLFGSWTGYSFGLVHQWRGSKRKALSYAERYPSIMRHTLIHEYQIDVPEDVCFKNWILNGGVGRLTWGILAAQSCQCCIDDIIMAQRQRLVEEHENGS